MDWPLLNALLNIAGGATWESLHNIGGVGIGFSQHTGVVMVCDGNDKVASGLNTSFGTTRVAESSGT